MPESEDVPPPRNLPTVQRHMVIGLTPEEFEPLRAQFQVDLAKLLGIPPDNVEIVAVRPRKKNK